MAVERARLFLSYSRKDGARVGDISRALDALGHDVWRDTEDLRGGESWRRSIVRGIRASDVVVLLLSPNSTVSDNVRRELDIADEEHRPVLPVVLTPTTVPDEMRYNLAGLQLLDLTELSPPDAAAEIATAVADRAPVPSSRWAVPGTAVTDLGALTGVPGGASAAVGDPSGPIPPVTGGTTLLDNGAAPAPTPADTVTPSSPISSGSRAGAPGRSRAALAVATGVAAAVLLAGGIAWAVRDSYTPSRSTLSVPCRGVGPEARTAIKGDGATPKAPVRSTWRNLLTGQAGEMDNALADGKGRFRIGFECLPGERGQAWVVNANDGKHTWRWTVNGVAP